MSDEINTHYAEDKAECPNCGTTGEMSFMQSTNSFYCGICGTNHDIEDLPDTVMNQ